jgi:SAM-dependent methyltransferase
LGNIRKINNDIILREILRQLENGGRRLLDVGSGLGFFLRDASLLGFDVTGIEPDANVVEASRNSGVQIRHGFFPDCLNPEEKFDVIVFNDVLEHISDVPGALDASASHLVPGGLLVLNCPDRDGIFYKLAVALDRVGWHEPFDRMWQRTLPSPHIWYFSQRDLKTFGKQRDLACVMAMKLKPISLSHIKSRVSYVRTQSRLTSYVALIGA